MDRSVEVPSYYNSQLADEKFNFSDRHKTQNISFDHGRQRKNNHSHDSSIKAKILDEHVRYNSLDQARKHLRDIIHQTKSVIKDAKFREVQAIQNEMSHREIYQQKLSESCCSYKMPLIKVSSNEKAFQSLKKLLFDLKGNKTSLNLSLGKINRVQVREEIKVETPSRIQLPQLNIVDKKLKMQEKEKKEIEQSINQFKTLKDINETLLKVPTAYTTASTPQRQNSYVSLFSVKRGSKQLSKDSSKASFVEMFKPQLFPPKAKEMQIFHTNRLYHLDYDQESLQKFYNYKQDINEKQDFIISVKTAEEVQLILFVGESPAFVKISSDQALYTGGLGVNSNKHILQFYNDISRRRVQWQTFEQENSDSEFQQQQYMFQRYGHLALRRKDQIIIFGGERGKEMGPSLRDLTNDVVIYNYQTSKIVRQQFDRAALHNRMYHCGFIMDHFLYSYGGNTNGGKILDSFLEIDLTTFKFREIEVNNKKLLPPLTNAQCCSAFYSSRLSKDGNLSFKKLGQKINWSESEHYIEQEGVYFFGGKDEESQANDLLTVMTISINLQNETKRTFIRPNTIGKNPPPRFMHRMEFYKEGNLILVFGGRNDQLQEKVLNDLWILKLRNLEWQQVSVAGKSPLKARFNFASVILESKLIIAGGIDKDFRISKDYQEIELDQSKISKRSTSKMRQIGKSKENMNFQPHQAENSKLQLSM